MEYDQEKPTVSSPASTALLCCPHCSSTSGFYRVTIMKGKGSTNYTFDGSEAYNGGLHDCLSYTEQKRALCIGCSKEIKQLKAS